MSRRAAAALAAVACVVLAACSSSATPDAAEAPADADLFAFQATSVAGDDVDMAQFADRDLVIWFWAPW